MTTLKPKAHSLKPKGPRPKPVIGMIGLGIMGSAMAANIVRAAYKVIGYDVDAARVRDHVRAGGIAGHSGADVGRRSDVVICSLPSASALAQVAAELAGSGGADVVVETSTLPLAVKEEARSRLAHAGVTLLDCPLSGTGSQAKVRDIVVYASGPRDRYQQAAPIMDAFARGHYYVGPFGAGSKTKFVANLLVAIHNVAAAEALVLAMKAGLDPALTLKVIADGGGSSRMLQVRGPMMVRGDYSEPTMKLDVWQKDMTVIADFARQVGCPTPLFAIDGAHVPRGNGRRPRRGRYRRRVCRPGSDGRHRASSAVAETQTDSRGLTRGQTRVRPLLRS